MLQGVVGVRCCKVWKVNFLTPRSDWHETSPYNIHHIIKLTSNENIQTYQVEAALLIQHQVLKN